MQIKYVIHSSDDSDYLKLWPDTAAFVKKLNYVPVLIHVTDNESELTKTVDGLVKKVKSIKNIPTALQGQLARIWGTSLFDDVVMISDIDMFLLNSKSFDDITSKYTPDYFLNIGANAYNRPYNRIPMCYNISHGNTFKSLLNIDSDYSKFVKKVFIECGDKWSTDEVYIAKKVNQYKKYIPIKRKFNNNIAMGRIDRANWKYDIKQKEKYIDCHFLREDYKDARRGIDNSKYNIPKELARLKDVFLNI